MHNLGIVFCIHPPSVTSVPCTVFMYCSMECRKIEAQAAEKKQSIDEQIAALQSTLQQMKGE